MPGDQRRARIGERLDRQLHRVMIGQPGGEYAQFIRMDQILGIVQHDRRARLTCRFVAQQRAPLRVEAIGLGRRPRRRPDHEPHPRVGCGDLCHRRRIQRA